MEYIPDLSSFELQNNILDSTGGNLNNGFSPLPMGTKTQIMDEHIVGAIYIWALNLTGSLDLANAVIDVTEIVGHKSNTVLSVSPAELEYFGVYGTTDYAPRLIKYSDTDKTYSIFNSSSNPIAVVDELIINVTTPAPTLDPLISTAAYVTSVAYTKYKPAMNALGLLQNIENIPIYQKKPESLFDKIDDMLGVKNF